MPCSAKVVSNEEGKDSCASRHKTSDNVGLVDPTACLLALSRRSKRADQVWRHSRDLRTKVKHRDIARYEHRRLEDSTIRRIMHIISVKSLLVDTSRTIQPRCK